MTPPKRDQKRAPFKYSLLLLAVTYWAQYDPKLFGSSLFEYRNTPVRYVC